MSVLKTKSGMVEVTGLAIHSLGVSGLHVNHVNV